jgi:hypothetical protein
VLLTQIWVVMHHNVRKSNASSSWNDWHWFLWSKWQQETGSTWPLPCYSSGLKTNISRCSYVPNVTALVHFVVQARRNIVSHIYNISSYVISPYFKSPLWKRTKNIPFMQLPNWHCHMTATNFCTFETAIMRNRLYSSVLCHIPYHLPVTSIWMTY